MAQPPFSWFPAEGTERPLIFASPHSGNVYPPAMRAALTVPLIDLRRTEDAHIDALIRPTTGFGANVLVANFARAYVDLNRDATELDPTMFSDGTPRACGIPGARVQAGLGSLPRVGASGRNIYAHRLSRAEGEARLATVHDAYHRRLRDELHRLRKRHGQAVLIDCHSMPSSQPGRRGLAEIVLGDRFGSSCCGRLTAAAERAFRKLGYKVARNAPYAGGYITRQYGRPRNKVHALQIEIRRDLYMDESTIRKTAAFANLHDDLMIVFRDLAAHVAEAGH
ncbi:MAG: N-formylglutamate amidohydrolase [Pseudomonadota bacterium]